MYKEREQCHAYGRVALAVLGTVVLGSLAKAQDVSLPDIKPLCGDKPMTIGLIDGEGRNTWRRIARSLIEQEAAKCPNTKKVLYAEAGMDQQKYNAAINSFDAEGVDIIVTFADFGDATLPTGRRVTKDGVTFVPYFTKLAGTPGVDYATQAYVDLDTVGKAYADWIGKTLGSGNIVFLGGTPGASSSQGYLDGMKEGLKKYPGIKLLDENYIVTNWNQADAYRTMSGLITKYGKLDAVATDSGYTTLATVKLFHELNLPVPPQITAASINELNCLYLKDKGTDKEWKYLSFDYTNAVAGVALRKGIAKFQGKDDGEPEAVVFGVYADSEAGKTPLCDPAAPIDADLSALAFLPKKTLYSIFNH